MPSSRSASSGSAFTCHVAVLMYSGTPCRTSHGARPVAQGNRRSPRSSQPHQHTRVRQGGPSRPARSRGFRPGRARMTLTQVVEEYVIGKRSTGLRFRSGAMILRTFTRVTGAIEVSDVPQDTVRAFLK